MPGTVCALAAESYTYSEIKAVVDRQFELLALDRLIKPGMKIVL